MQGKKTGGRQLGTANKLTRSCREALEHAADALGGAERLAQWAAETPENETLFWTEAQRASRMPPRLPRFQPLFYRSLTNY